MKNFKRILCTVLCFAMIVPMFTIAPSAQTDTGTALIDEDFENTPIGSLPDNWTINGGTGLKATVESSTVEIKDDVVEEPKAVNKALNVSHLTSGTAINAKHDFARSSTAFVSFDYQMQSLTAPVSTSRPNGGSNGISFYCYNDDYTTDQKAYYRIAVLYVSETMGRLTYMDASNVYHNILGLDGEPVYIEKGEWYHFEMSVDSSAESGTTIKYKVDSYGKILAEGSIAHTKSNDPNRLVFHCMGTDEKNDSFFIDNLYLKAGSHVYTTDFESDAVNSLPQGIDKLNSGTVKTVEKELFNNKALYVSHLTGAGNTSAVKNTFATTQYATVSVDYQMESMCYATTTGTHSITFWNSGTVYYRVAVRRVSDDKGKLVVHDGNNYIDVTDSNGNVVEIERGVFYHFEVSCDTSPTDHTLLTYKVSKDGKLLAEGSVKNTRWKTDINYITIQTTGSNHFNDAFYIDNLMINNGTSTVDETFEEISLETAKPTVSGITYEGGASNPPSFKVISLPLKAVVVDTPEESEKEYYTTKALYVTDTSTTTGPIITYKTFSGVDTITAEFDYMLATEESYAANGFALGGGGTGTYDLRVLLKVFPNGDGTSTLKYYNGSSWISSTATKIVPFKWYSIKIEANQGESTVAVYVNGGKVCDAWARPTIERMDRVIFQSHNAAGTGDKFYIDNLKITTPTVFGDEPITFEDNFEGATLPEGYSFKGNGSNSFGDGALTLNGEIRAIRTTSYTKSGKFSFSVKTNNVDGLYFGLSVDNTDVYMIKSDNLGRLFYQRDKVDVAINTRELIKANEWVNIAIDLPYDRNAPYAYLYVDGEMRGHILYNALSDYVNGIFIGAEAGTTVSVKDVKCELSDGVIKIPERTESDPIVYVPEVVGGQVLYLASDKSPKTSTLAPVGDGTITVDKKYTSIGFDAGSVQKINAIRITTANAEEFKVNYRYFSLYTSNDNKNWQSFGKVTYNHFLENGKWTMLFEFSGVEARYVKLNFTSDTCLNVTVENPTENIRAERRIDRQWKMAGQNMTAFGDTAPMFTPMIRHFVEDEGVEIKTGDSVGLNFGLASPVEAVELVANGLSSIEGDAFEVYTSNDNCVYDKVEQVIISRDERDGKEVLRFTFDSVECTYIKLFVKGEGISLSLDSLTDGFCAYSSVEASSFEVNGIWTTRGGEGDFYTLSDGTIVMTYIGYGAAGDGDFVDNDILAKISTDGGKTWSKSWIMMSKQIASGDQLESVNIMQTRLFWLENDELGILYHEKNAGENQSNLYFRRSYDLGRNWEDPIKITEIYDPYYSLMSSGNCVNRLPNGRILFATTTCEYVNDVWGTPHVKVYIWYSDDVGYTWERSDGAIVLPNTTCEPCIAPLENGDLLITMRTRKEAKIYQSISSDGGNTWAQPVAVEGIVTPSSTNTIVTIPATGDVLLIWNDEYATDNGNRDPLTFAVSSDNGLTYKNKKNTIEAGASWPVMTFYGRRAYMQPSSGVKVCDVEELYYTKYGATTLADLPKAATPAATYDSGWLKGVSSTMKYSLDGGITWRFCGGTSVQIGEDHSEILVKDIGTHETAPSDIQIVK